MIAFIKGTVADIEEDRVVVESNNIGYNIFVPSTYTAMISQTGMSVKLYTYMSVKEDSIHLFGFRTKEELILFKKMITVSGIGPKGALSILSTLTVDNLRIAIMADDAKAIAKAPGIGAKTASKLILELKDSVTLPSMDDDSATGIPSLPEKGNDSQIRKDAVEGLIALGYSASEAFQAVKQVAVEEGDDAGKIIKQALKKMH